MESLKADYLIVGAGASGMAFLDELVHNSDQTVVVVDRRAQPGGHWVDAYDFVTLHQPAAFYGVNSRNLGAGGACLASKTQILAYYELVMKDLVATGRVTWLPLTDFRGNGHLVSLVQEGLEYQVTVGKKIVDTFTQTPVPSTQPPNYLVEEDVHHVPVNGLTKITKPWQKYVIIGAGKTGLDALLYLLDLKVNPENIFWIVSNDCWYLNREAIAKGGFAGPDAVKSILASQTVEELYKNYEDNGLFMRISKEFEPTKMRAATVSEAEMTRVRQIKNILREGRVESITSSLITFKNGVSIPTDLKTLHVHCSTNGTLWESSKPIFSGSKISLQMVQLPAPTNSASIVAALELLWPDAEMRKNEICTPVEAPHDLQDWFINFKRDLCNGQKIRDALGFRWHWNRRLTAYNMSDLLGFPLGLFIGAIRLLKLSQNSENQIIERLSNIFEMTKI